MRKAQQQQPLKETTMNTIPFTRRTEPMIPAGHPKFVWTTGADVQATWRRYGWVPPSELKPAIPEQKERALQTSQL
jgi:hypothetical protein